MLNRVGSIPTSLWVLIFWRILSVRCSTPHCRVRYSTTTCMNGFRLNEDACKTTQAYATMEKRHAIYPNMLWIAWLPRKRHIFKRLVTVKLNELLDIVLDDLLRMSEGKEHATSLDDLKDTISNLSYCNQMVWRFESSRADHIEISPVAQPVEHLTSKHVSCIFPHHIYADRESNLVCLMFQRQPIMAHTWKKGYLSNRMQINGIKPRLMS